MAVTTYTAINGVIVHEDRGGTQRNYRPDTLGNTVALTDATTATDTMTYWPYGEIRTRTGTNATRFLFVGTLGYSKDVGYGLHYVRARFYQATRGRWTTVDLLWPNELPFSYSQNCPNSKVDPSGMRGVAVTKEDCCTDNALIAALGALAAGLITAIGACLICMAFTAGLCGAVCGPAILAWGLVALLAALATFLLFYAWCMNSPYSPCNTLPTLPPCPPTPVSGGPPLPGIPPIPGIIPGPGLRGRNRNRNRWIDCDKFALDWCIRYPRTNCYTEEYNKCLGQGLLDG